jgi:hypothetical protein
MAPGIEIHVPADLRGLYEIHEYRHGAALLYSEFPALYQEICEALRTFRLTRSQLIEGGGNESQIPKTFARLLRSKGWTETKMSAAMVIDDQTVQQDTHKIDLLKVGSRLTLSGTARIKHLTATCSPSAAFLSTTRLVSGFWSRAANDSILFFEN